MKSFAAILAIAGFAAAQTGAPVAPGLASCTSNFQICAASGTNVANCERERSICQVACLSKYDACRAPGAPNGNIAPSDCATRYASCLGFNPFTPGGATTVTAVVTGFVTFCPAATTFTQGGSTYTAHGPTLITVTACPCTVTAPLNPAGPTPTNPAGNNPTVPAGNNPTNPAGTGNGTVPRPTGPVATFTGAAPTMAAAGLSAFAVGAGALAYLL